MVVGAENADDQQMADSFNKQSVSNEPSEEVAAVLRQLQVCIKICFGKGDVITLKISSESGKFF